MDVVALSLARALPPCDERATKPSFWHQIVDFHLPVWVSFSFFTKDKTVQFSNIRKYSTTRLIISRSLSHIKVVINRVRPSACSKSLLFAIVSTSHPLYQFTCRTSSIFPCFDLGLSFGLDCPMFGFIHRSDVFNDGHVGLFVREGERSIGSCRGGGFAWCDLIQRFDH